jgi:hypothetical protein
MTAVPQTSREKSPQLPPRRENRRAAWRHQGLAYALKATVLFLMLLTSLETILRLERTGPPVRRRPSTRARAFLPDFA